MEPVVVTRSHRRYGIGGRFTLAGALAATAGIALWAAQSLTSRSAVAYPSAGAAIPTWGAMASAGTVDEASADAIALSGTQASISGASGSGTLRYNFVVVNGFDSTSDGFTLWVRFRDNGSSSRVRAWFRATDIVSGATTTLATFDSNDYAPSANYQLAGIDNCDIAWDFYNNVYFVEARLDKAASAGSPGLAALQVSQLMCGQ